MPWIGPAIGAAGSIAGGLLGGGGSDPVADVRHIYGKDFGNKYVNPWREGVMERGDRSY